MFQVTVSPSALIPARTTSPVAGAPTKSERLLSASSKAAYAKDVELFRRAGGAIPCGPAVVLRYVEVMRTRLAARTLYRRLMAVQHAHTAAGHPSPLADAKVRAIAQWLQAGKHPPKSDKSLVAAKVPPRARGARKAKPVTRQLLDRMLDAMHRAALCRRDRALLLLSFAGALKRSEVVAINVEDLRWTADAMIVTIREGVEDQRGRHLAIPQTGGELCAATAVKQYIEHLALEPGTPLFRSFNRASEQTDKRLAAAFVNEVLKTRLKVVGIDPTGYSGESLRVGRLIELAKGVL